MKQLFLIFVTIMLVNLSYAQFDSAAIVQQHAALRNNISSYVNQPFSVLYNALTIKPTILTGFSPHNNRFVEYASQFHYADPNNPKYWKVYVYVEWESEIPTSETLMYQNKVRRNFDSQEYSIYASKIVKKAQFFPDPMVDDGGVLMKKKPIVKQPKKQ